MDPSTNLNELICKSISIFIYLTSHYWHCPLLRWPPSLNICPLAGKGPSPESEQCRSIQQTCKRCLTKFVMDRRIPVSESCMKSMLLFKRFSLFIFNVTWPFSFYPNLGGSSSNVLLQHGTVFTIITKLWAAHLLKTELASLRCTW